MNLKQKIISGFKWSYLNVFVQALLQLLVLAILSRLLAPKDFGLISISFIFVNIARLISEIGIGPSIVQKKDITKKHLSSGFIFSVLMGFLIFVFFLLFSSSIGNFFKNRELALIIKIISINFIFNGVSTVPLSLLKKKMKFKDIMYLNLLSYFIGYGIIGVGMAFLGFGVWALVFASLSQNFLKMIISFFLSSFKISFMFYRMEFAELLKFGGGFTIGRIFNYFALNGDNFVIGKTLGPYWLGIYSRSYALLNLPAKYFSSVFDKVLFPAFSEIQQNKRKIKEVFINSSQLVFFASTVIAVFIFLFAKMIVLIILGEKWFNVVPLLKILAFAIPFRTTYKLSDAISRALGTIYKRAWRQGVYASFIIIGAYIGSFYNLVVVSYFILFSIFLIYILMLDLSAKSLEIKFKEIILIHYTSIIYFTIFVLYYFILKNLVNSFISNFLLLYFIYFIGFILLSLLIVLFFLKNKKLESLFWIINKMNNKFLNKLLKII